MTPEEKVKRYNEVLEMAKIAYKDEDRHLKATLERIFPELKESEDEKIKEAIIDIIESQKEQQCHIDSAIYDKMIAWLEKQGEPNPYSGTSFKYNGHTWGMRARDNGVEIGIDSELKAFISLDKSFIYPIRNQSIIEPKSALESINEEKVDNANNVEPKDYSSIDPHFGKHIDKVEPKFKKE